MLKSVATSNILVFCAVVYISRLTISRYISRKKVKQCINLSSGNKISLHIHDIPVQTKLQDLN